MIGMTYGSCDITVWADSGVQCSVGLYILEIMFILVIRESANVAVSALSVDLSRISRRRRRHCNRNPRAEAHVTTRTAQKTDGRSKGCLQLVLAQKELDVGHRDLEYCRLNADIVHQLLYALVYALYQ